MSPTRRQVVSAIAVGGFVPGTVATAEAQRGDDQDFSPDITINDNNLVATIGERDGDVDPDTVTVYTANGEEHEFDGAAPNDFQAGDAFEVGYTHDESRARIEGWHGVVDSVTATKDGETVTARNDAESTLEVTCSLWKTPDQPPTEFEVFSEGARKHHMNRDEDSLSEDQRQYGSPGRALETVAERNPEIAMRVEFDGCDPETQKALRFDCTSVTVEPEELNQGENRIEDVQLRFADGTFERPPGTATENDDGAFELPVTLSGSGDNEGKVVDRLEFKVPNGEYTYWNLEADQCAAQQGGGSDDGNGGSDDGGNDDGSPNDDGTGSDGGGNGSSDGSGDDSGNEGPGTDSESGGDESPSGDSTGSQDDGSDGGSGDSSSSGSGGSSTSSSGDDSGGLLDTDSNDATETPTPDGSNSENVTVNGTDRTSGANDTGTANGSGASGNGSSGGENGSTSGNSDPGIATGTPADDQPGMGFAAGLGGLLGFGEFARRRLGVDDEE